MFLKYFLSSKQHIPYLALTVCLFFQMQVVIVDGAHENTVKELNLTGVLQGLAPIQPPPNGIIAFPCPPGIIRPEKERL